MSQGRDRDALASKQCPDDEVDDGTRIDRHAFSPELVRGGDDAEATALRQRLDLGALRRDLDVTAGRQGWATIGTIFGDIGASYSNNTSTERATGHSDKTQGWEFDVPLPLFDWGFAARGMARNQVLRSASLLRDNAIRARSEARSNWLAYRTAYDLAQQQQAEVLPLAKLMQEETVYRYNGMFTSVWQLLAQARSTGNLYSLLRDELDRSRSTFIERFGEDLERQSQIFLNTLVQQLCAGEADKLGATPWH